MVWLVCVGCFFAIFALGAPPWSWWLAAIAVLVAIVDTLPPSGPMEHYNRLIEASSLNQPNAVFQCAEELARTGGRGIPDNAAEYIDYRIAAMLWALERDDEAEEVVRPHATLDGGANERRYWMGRGYALISAHRFEEGFAAMRRALATGTPTGVEVLDAALHHARVHTDPAEARALFQRAEAMRVGLASSLYRPYVDGLICVREGRFEDAVDRFRVAARWARWAPLPRAMRAALQTEISVGLCLAHAGLRSPAAREYFEAVRDRLEQAGELELLTRCENALTESGIPYR